MIGIPRLTVLLLWLCAAAAAQAEDLVLNAAGGHVVTATINGVLLHLRVVLDAHGFIILNRAAAQAARLGEGDGRSVMAIGPVRLKGRHARRAVTIGGTIRTLPISWYDAAIDAAADGVISPALLPQDRVTLKFPGATGRRELRFRVQFSDNEGLHLPVSVGGAYSIAARLAPTEPYSVAAGAAAAMLAATHGGRLSPDMTRIEIGFGVRRPARWLTLARPVVFGGITLDRVLMRTGDFLGEHPLPPGETPPADDEIVVTGTGERQQALYRMTLGRDVLGDCGEAEYRRAERTLILRCR